MKYIRVNIVDAEPMTRHEFDNLKEQDHACPYDAEGYHVIYPDGYESWCPKAQFDRAGFPIKMEDRISPEDVAEFVARGTEDAEKIGEKTLLLARKYATGIEDFATSSCVNPEYFSAEIGIENAREKLDGQVWAFLGWALGWAREGVDKKTVERPCDPENE